MGSALVIVYLFTTIVCMGLTLLTIRNKEIDGRLRYIFATVIVCVGIWCFSNAMVQLSTSAKSIWFWHEFKFIGVLPLPSLLVYFSLRYTKNDQWINRLTMLLMIAFPIFIGLTVYTSQWFGAFRVSYEVISTSSIVYANTVNGWSFYLNAVYTYSGFGLTFYVLIREYFRLPKYYRTQPVLIGIATVLPFFINFTFVTGISNQTYDFTALAFGATVVLFYAALFYFRVPDVIPIARNKVIDSLSDVVLICDNTGKVIDYNNHAKDVLFKYNINTDVVTFNQGFSKFLAMKGARQVPFNSQQVYEIMTDDGLNYYDFSSTDIEDDGNILGKLIVFRNVTESYRMLERLRKIATTDPLTRLYNRSYFTEFVDEVEGKFSIIYGGINSFKLINDSFGTNVGDIILQRVGDVFRTVSPENAIVGRYEGDEFVAVIRDDGVNVHRIIERIEEQVHQIKVNHASISICLVHHHYEQMDQSLNDMIGTTKLSMDRKKLLETDSAKSSIIASLRLTLEQSDYETKKHTDRTSLLASKIGKKLGMSEREIHDLMLLATLHDIGKVAIPDAILLKPGKLDNEEFEIMKTHTKKGYDIAVSSPELLSIAEGILQHHEKYDGTGYPNGLKGEEISLDARIVTLVDSFDVMMNERPYKKAMSLDEAVAEVKRCRGKHFDPMIVDILLEIVE